MPAIMNQVTDKQIARPYRAFGAEWSNARTFLDSGTWPEQSDTRSGTTGSFEAWFHG